MNHPDVLSTAREPQAPQAGAQFLPPALLAASLLAGTALSLLVLPGWLTGLARSLQGEQPTVFWLLSRASALVSFGLLWLSMALGLLITGKTARLWPGSATTFDLHEHTSLLGLIFGLLHALLLLGDQYIHFDAVQIVLPFASLGYRPLAVGLGQLALYAWAMVHVSFYLRRQMGQPAWRALHAVSFAVFVLALFHGVTAGTDAGALGGIYWLAGGSLLFLLVYRLLVMLFPAPRKEPRRTA